MGGPAPPAVGTAQTAHPVGPQALGRGQGPGEGEVSVSAAQGRHRLPALAITAPSGI